MCEVSCSLVSSLNLLILSLATLCNFHLSFVGGAEFFSGTLGSTGLVTINSNAQNSHHHGSEEWDSSLSRSGSYGNGYTCVNIPSNFTLCTNIEYTKMMVPNLLGHDSLQEAEYHAKSWIPLLRLQCHPDTQLFLCSLFSPICLDRPIYPCRSLCQVVQASCEPRMLPYNYPWPSMLRCEQFPEDHDLCIRPGAANAEKKKNDTDCPSCHQAHTCENIVDNFCRADFVFRAKFKGVSRSGNSLEFRKGRWFKPKHINRGNRPDFLSFDLNPKDHCCSRKLRSGSPYIVMGLNLPNQQRQITFIMPWNGKDRIVKNAVKTFRSMDCSNPLPMSVMAVGEEGRRSNSTTGAGGRRRRKKDGQNRRRGGRKYSGCRVIPIGRN